MKTFEKVLEIFREYLDCDLEEEVLPCREGYLRVTWNGDSRYCVDGLLSRTPDELFEVLLSDYRSYEELRLTKGCREVTEEDIVSFFFHLVILTDVCLPPRLASFYTPPL